MIIRFDGNGTGTGTLDLQTASPAQSSVENTAYAFSLSGSDLIQPTPDPLLTSGAFTLDSNGNIITTGATAGIEDFSYKFPAVTFPDYYGLALSGSLAVGTGTTPGTATFTTSFGTLKFDVYSVDSTHMKLIESDGQYILVGDVFSAPTASIPQGTLVFTASGLDGSGNPFAAGGTVSSDGASALSSGAEDVNDAGQVDGGSSPATPQGFTGSFAASPSGSGRFVVNLTNFAGGTVFAAYPSSGGILLQEIDTTANAGITGGVAMAQTSGAAIATPEGYGMSFTASDLTNTTELDGIGEFTTTSTNLSGLSDLNDFGVANPKTVNLVGQYSASSNGTGSMTFTSGPLGGVFYYAADNSNIVFISTDSTDVAVGGFEQQSTPSSATAAAQIVERHLTVLKTVRALKLRKQ